MTILDMRNKGNVTSKKARAKHSVMNNSGFGPVKVIQEGEKKLDVIGQYMMTIEQAMKHYENGLAITVA